MLESNEDSTQNMDTDEVKNQLVLFQAGLNKLLKQQGLLHHVIIINDYKDADDLAQQLCNTIMNNNIQPNIANQSSQVYIFNKYCCIFGLASFLPFCIQRCIKNSTCQKL